MQPAEPRDESFDGTIAALDSAIAKGRLPESRPTYRVLRGAPLLEEIERHASAGIPWPSSGFTSATLSHDSTREFLSKTLLNMIFEWETPAGTPVAFPAESTGQLAHQFEILLGRKTRFEIVSIDKSGDPVRVKVRLLQ